MSTLGHELLRGLTTSTRNDDHLAPRFSSGPVVQQQARELTLLEYGEPEAVHFPSPTHHFWCGHGVRAGARPQAHLSPTTRTFITMLSGETDGAPVRSWALEPRLPCPFTDYPQIHTNDIKLEPLVGSGECTTHTLLVAETDNSSTQAERKITDDALSNGSQDEKAPAETKVDLDPSKCS